MFHRTLARYSRRITLPQLSPTHSLGRIVRFEVSNGDSLEEYDPVFTIECSADMVTEGYRDYPTQQQLMIIDTQEPGIIRDIKAFYIDQWIPVGTELGIIDDGEEMSGDWTWQAYTATVDESSSNDKKNSQ
mmetsp:Transcript_17828/g.20535  ORF Transcript_17828/g.20535 Transcript_17828/m.20535 type:complete len:131 (-) Transcript_17828:407-799(-)|eukprot:CAMPEP_0194154228 /NCGR_PEP_ID=MMETSP0152-20130528/59798_1 /TAXON_ID=1049557 /ORGANISM="Thalassiothrix antarctica, Strain L6-D1" /LENGTH=130 /DNA_ID=CAMNT_0038860161 /DNA_START=91 /DNA_END=483 /DNA_ORIENTATION=-